MKKSRSLVARILGLLLVAICFAGSTWAAVPFPDPEIERQAKFAVPGEDEALLYVYRVEGGPPESVTIKVNDLEATALEPGRFFLWRIAPGRVEIRVEPAGEPVIFSAEPGRVYYFELALSSEGVPELRRVPFAVGRPTIQRLRLVAASSDLPPKDQPHAQPRFAVSIKGGAFMLADESQTVAGTQVQFDDSASSVYAMEGEWFLQPATSLGLEVLNCSNDYTAAGGAARGSADSLAVLFNVKRYLRSGESLQPYAGLGLGFVDVDLAGDISGNGSGPALQLAAGLQWRASRFLLRAEYKYLHARAEDDNDQEIDVSGSGIFVGLGVQF